MKERGMGGLDGSRLVDIIEQTVWVWSSDKEKLGSDGAFDVREAMIKVGMGPVDLVIVDTRGNGVLISGLTCDPGDWSLSGEVDNDMSSQLSEGKIRVSFPKRLAMSPLGAERVDDYKDGTTGRRSPTSHRVRMGRTFENGRLMQPCFIGVLRADPEMDKGSRESTVVGFRIGN